MNNNWESLKTELGIFGIDIIDQNTCSFVYENKKYKSLIITKRKFLHKKFRQNTKIIQELFLKMCEIFSSPKKNIQIENEQNEVEPIDQKLIKLFIFSVKDSYKLADILNDLPIYEKFFTTNKILPKIRQILNTDYLEFDKEVTESVPDMKIAIDSIFRKNQLLIYLDRLLSLIEKGERKINGMFQKQAEVKLADGISGPWANLDIPMLERKFPWDDIEEETRGRDKDLRKQKRYRIDNYSPGSWLSEGYVWREMRNEPYSWETRFEDSPYVQNSPGAWR